MAIAPPSAEAGNYTFIASDGTICTARMAQSVTPTDNNTKRTIFYGTSVDCNRVGLARPIARIGMDVDLYRDSPGLAGAYVDTAGYGACFNCAKHPGFFDQAFGQPPRTYYNRSRVILTLCSTKQECLNSTTKWVDGPENNDPTSGSLCIPGGVEITCDLFEPIFAI